MAAATAAAAAAPVRAVAAAAGAQREPPLPPSSSSSSPRAGFPAAAATARSGCPRSGGGGVSAFGGFGRRSCLAVGRGRGGRPALALSASSSPLMRTSSGMWWHESRQSQQQHQQQHRQQRQQQQWEDADDVSVGRGPVSCMAASPSLNGGPMGVDVAAADEQLRNAEPPAMTVGGRHAVVSRVTRETSVEVSIGLDGTGQCSSSTGIPFLDHMIDQLASHGLFDVTIRAEGDLHIDDHHTNEDVGLALGTALAKALGDRKGIHRFGDFCAPLDEALVHVVLDLSGRPHLSCDLHIPTERVGTYDTQLVEHFFQSLVNTSGMTLHIRQLAGKNSHHIIEATFKAFARALRVATEVDPRRANTIPSSKGVLSRQ